MKAISSLVLPSILKSGRCALVLAVACTAVSLLAPPAYAVRPQSPVFSDDFTAADGNLCGYNNWDNNNTSRILIENNAVKVIGGSVAYACNHLSEVSGTVWFHMLARAGGTGATRMWSVDLLLNNGEWVRWCGSASGVKGAYAGTLTTETPGSETALHTSSWSDLDVEIDLVAHRAWFWVDGVALGNLDIGASAARVDQVWVRCTDSPGAAGDCVYLDDFSIGGPSQISGTVSFDTLVSAPYAFDRVVVFTASNGSGALAEWPLMLHLTNDINSQLARAAYTLAGVPDGITLLSAKTALSLRQRLGIALDPNGQVSHVDFALRGGDLNDSNSINILDYVLLKTKWLATGPTVQAVDINGDGVANTSDYEIMKSNWFGVGEP